MEPDNIKGVKHFIFYSLFGIFILTIVFFFIRPIALYACNENDKCGYEYYQMHPCEDCPDANINGQHYVELKEKIIAVQNENDKRLAILMPVLGGICTLLVVIIGLSAYNNANIAEEKAQKTASEEIKKYKDEFEAMKDKYDALMTELETTIRQPQGEEGGDEEQEGEQQNDNDNNPLDA